MSPSNMKPAEYVTRRLRVGLTSVFCRQGSFSQRTLCCAVDITVRN